MSFRLPDPKRLNTYAGIWLYLLGRIIKFEFGRYEFASASDKHETTVSITVSSPTITEGNSGTKNLTYLLTLDKAPTEAVTVMYQTLETGTATAGDDFSVNAGTITFAAGQSVVTLSISVNGDSDFESNETVRVKFSGSKLGADVTATGTITNDDVNPQIAIDAADAIATTTYNTALSAYNTAASAAATALTAATQANAAYDTAAAAVTTLAAANAASTLAATSATAAAAAVTAANAQTAAATALQTAAAATLSTADNTVASAAVSASTTAATAAANTVSAAATDTAAAASRVASYAPGVFQLTANVDSGTTFTGGSGDDTFNADLTAAGGNTLNALDRLNGGAGADILNAVLAADVTPSSIIGIESIVATGSGAARILGLTNAPDVTSVTSSGSAGGVMTVTGIAAGANLAVQSQAVGADFQFATTTGTQSTNLSVAAVTGAATITVDGVETIAVTASGSASTYQLAADAVTTLSFAGASNQTVTLADMTGVSHFNASAATGNVNITLINQSALLATTDVTVSGGSGDDTITVTAHTQSAVSVAGGAGNDTVISTAWATTDSVNGGEGIADVISMDNASAVTLGAAARTTFTNLEQLTVTDHFDQGAGLTVANISSGITTVNLTHTSAAGVALTDEAETIVGGAGSMTINLGGNLAANVGLLGAAFTVTDTGTATTDTVTINNVARNSGANLDVFAGNNLTSTGYENVVISTGSGTGNAEQDIATLTITPDSVSANVSLTVSGPSAFHVDTSLTTTSTGLLTVNAAGLTAQTAGTATLTIDATSQGTGGTASITGSSGDDLIVIGNFASTIIGGAGNDTLTGGTAADNLQGGDGVDTISDGGGNDIITGDAGNDVITISGTSVNVDAGDGDDTVNADATLSAGDVVNGGAGNDTLAIDAAATAESSQGVTNIELLRADTALTQDMVQFTTNAGFTRLISNVAGAVTFNNVGANANELRAISSGANTTTFDRLLDNSSNALTVGTFTDANTTLNNLTANDEETINIVAGGATTAGRTFAITTLTAGDLVTLNVSGDTVFSTTIAAQGTAVLTTVNASTATGTVVVSATNATLAVTMTGSATAASTLTGGSGADVITGGAAADSLVGGTGADTINGAAGDDVLLGGGNADSITAGEGADNITGGTGNDAIVLTETTAAIDNVILEASLTNGVDTLTGFATGTGIDTITFVNADTTVATGAGAAAFETIAAVTLVTGATYRLDTDNATTTAAMDVYELLGTNASNGDLSLSTNGTELFKLLGTADSAATTITMDAADDNVFLIAYDNGNAYIYNVQDQATGATAIATEVILVAVINGVAIGALDAGDLLTAV